MAHQLVLEKMLPREEDKQYPICLDGEGNCPLEECGGYMLRMSARSLLPKKAKERLMDKKPVKLIGGSMKRFPELPCYIHNIHDF